MFKEAPLPSRYGEFGASGDVVKDAKFCAVTGQPIEAGDPMIRVQDAPVFYRIKASVYRRMTNEDHERLYAEIRSRGNWPTGAQYDAAAVRVVLPEAPVLDNFAVSSRATAFDTLGVNEAFPTNPSEETRGKKGLSNG